MGKCPTCGKKVEKIKWKCFNCGKEQTEHQNRLSMNYDLKCCLSCIYKIIQRSRTRKKR